MTTGQGHSVPDMPVVKEDHTPWKLRTLAA